MAKLIGKVALIVLVFAVVVLNLLFIDVTGKEVSPKTQQLELTLEEAEAIALKAVPGSVKNTVLEEENGKYVYEVEISINGKEKEVQVDAINGNILGIETEDDEKDEQVTQEVLEGFPGRISESKAGEIALKEVDGEVLGISMEKEGVNLFYEVKIRDGKKIYEVEIEAVTGEVIEVEED